MASLDIQTNDSEKVPEYRHDHNPDPVHGQVRADLGEKAHSQKTPSPGDGEDLWIYRNFQVRYYNVVL